MTDSIATEPLMTQQELNTAIDSIKKMSKEEFEELAKEADRLLREAGIDVDNLIKEQKPLDPELSRVLFQNIDKLYAD